MLCLAQTALADEAGVKTIEHGHLMNEEGAKLMAIFQERAYTSPN